MVLSNGGDLSLSLPLKKIKAFTSTVFSRITILAHKGKNYLAKSLNFQGLAGPDGPKGETGILGRNGISGEKVG